MAKDKNLQITQILGRLASATLTLVSCLSAPLFAENNNAAQTFLNECGMKAKDMSKGSRLAYPGKDGWLFLRSELRHLSAKKFWGEEAIKTSRARSRKNADPLPAIVDFNNQLKQLGLKLIVVPIPPKAIIYPDMLTDLPLDKNDLPPRLDIQHQKFYSLLRDKGVNVLDLTAELINQRYSDKGAMYCRQDSHYSGQACQLIARLLAKEIGEIENAVRLELSSQEAKYSINGDLWNSLQDKDIPRESLLLRFIGMPNGQGIEPLAADRESPLLLIGDSHLLAFHAGGDMHAAGAGLADQLAYELGLAIDVLAVRGSAATTARISLYRRGKAQVNYLKNKKNIIWCFAAREFTEADGWRKVPVVKQ